MRRPRPRSQLVTTASYAADAAAAVDGVRDMDLSLREPFNNPSHSTPEIALSDVARQLRQPRKLEQRHFVQLERKAHVQYATDARHQFRSTSFHDALTASLVGRPGQPVITVLTELRDRPRQFEYSPLVADQLVYGTHNGNLVVVNQDSRRVIGACCIGGGKGHREPGELVSRMAQSSVSESPSIRDWVSAHGKNSVSGVSSRDADPMFGSRNTSAPTILGLSWLRQQPNLFLAGSDAGAIHLYNVDWMSSGQRGGCVKACDSFDQLTSIHVSSDDRQFIASGYSRHVSLYDLESGALVEEMLDIHDQHINVIKFAYHNPNVFVTSSFDRYIKKWDLREARPGGSRRPIFARRSGQGNVMACFSPNDEQLLVSAVDNEVIQYSASDGRLERRFNIHRTGLVNNYTRSYYMNNGAYVITGSCKEDMVRVYNASTGRCLREIELDGEHSGLSYVQSLRANPHRDFNLSVLLTYDDSHFRVGRNAESVFDVLANINLAQRMPCTRA
jgi:hypothetical protein